MTERLPDWEARLSAYVAEMHGAEFVWGKTDCALFFADAVKAITGADPAKEFRGKYSTAMGSRKALIRYGQGDLESTLNAKFPVKAAGFVQRGDGV